MGGAAQFVFGYGSLAAEAVNVPAVLHGHRRVWGVAMDNRVDIPGYKSYRLASDGRRPAVFVAFLDIVEDGPATTTGALVAVDDARLDALDARERNYDRIDVTRWVADVPAGAIVWTYRGSAAGRARFAEGRSTGSAVVDTSYLSAVQAALVAIGSAGDMPDPEPLRTVALLRLDIAPQDVSGAG